MLTKFYDSLRQIYNLGGISSLLDWDQKVMMPEGGGDDRAEQIELISILIHEKTTDPRFIENLEQLWAKRADLAADDLINIRETKRICDRSLKLPKEFVAERTRTAALAYQAWVIARPKNDFESIVPLLEKIVEQCRQETDYVGYEKNAYDALLDQYEPGGKIDQVRPLLLRLGKDLTPLLPELSSRFESVPPIIGNFTIEQQKIFNLRIAQIVGYDLKRGRLDSTAHPFQTSIGFNDVRITTRFSESNVLSSLYSVLHEVGHALYEMGFVSKHRGTPLGSAVSLGIHESQSRLWENIIGRSLEFCAVILAQLQELFPEQFHNLTQESLWQQANRVQASLIRVESDEVSYTQHIIIRMLLEEALIKGELQVRDLPQAWNDLYQQYLGLTPDSNRNGVMQDVHWFSGSIGYFPTYALGNLYGAMLIKKAESQIENFWGKISNGECSELLAWLRTNVHTQGMRFPGPILIKDICGEELNEGTFLNYIKAKFRVH